MNAEEKYQEILDRYPIEDIKLISDSVTYKNQLCKMNKIFVKDECIDERYFDLYGREL